MTHPVDTAFPTGTWLPLTVRQTLAAGFAWTIADADDLRNLNLGATALTVNTVVLSGTLFTYDAADSSTADDGVTCIVSSDGKRFKTGSLGSTSKVFRVISSTTDTPPGSPTLGDWYRIPAAPTGDWASNADDLTVYTGNGWLFVSPQSGYLVYVRDTKVYEHYSEDGAWTEGIGSSTLTAGSVVPAKLEWPLGISVEAEQAAPPGGTPAAGTAYLVGSSATGDWSGQDTKLARADGAGAWTFVAAYEGARVYDKTSNVEKVFHSGAWTTAAGSYVTRLPETEDSVEAQTVEHAGTANNNTVGYVWSATSAPTTSTVARVLDAWQPTITAKKAGAEFELFISSVIRWTMGNPSTTSPGSEITLTAMALFIDSEASPRDWLEINEVPTQDYAPDPVTTAYRSIYLRRFVFTLADTSAHTLKLRYYFRVQGPNGSNTNISAVDLIRKHYVLLEAA